jgi:hypothetical protein
VGDDSFRNASKPVFHLKQTSKPVEFGKTPPDDFDKLLQLFAAQGQLQIIETPFKDGEHVCTSPAQAVSLIQDLRTLHRNGCSHGDIRAFNCVFSDTGSHLIDFDFGGRKVTYPKGYQTFLEDGRRIPNSVLKRDRAIHKWHDVYALVKLLLELHEVTPHSVEFSDLTSFNLDLPFLGMTNDETDQNAADFLDRVEIFLRDKAIKPTRELESVVNSTKPVEQKTLGGFGGTPEHRKKL